MADGSMFQDSPGNAALHSLVCEALFEAIEDGLCLLSPASRVIGANLGFAEMIGTPLHLLNESTLDAAPEQSPATSRLAELIIESGLDGQGASQDITGPDGRRLRARLIPIVDKQGRRTALLIHLREINLERARAREMARVEQRARFSELSAGLAHEIKNPLAGIQGAMDILIGRRPPDDAELEVLEGVRREVRRIDKTVQSLLDRARPRRPDLRPASIAETVEHAVQLAQATLSAAQRGRIAIEFESAVGPHAMSIDILQIEDAVLSLILNAIDAIDDAGTISVRVYDVPPGDEGGEVVIEVADTGRGIPGEDLTRVFSPFYTTNPDGTGLGLSAVRGIARAHKGRVEVSSTVGFGTTFSLHLPLHPLDKRFPSAD